MIHFNFFFQFMYRIHTRSLSLNSAFIAAAHPDATSHLARARDMSTLGFYFRQYIGFILSLVACVGICACERIAGRLDADVSRVIYVSVVVAVLALVLHELRPYKRNAGLTFDKAHAAREVRERRRKRRGRELGIRDRRVRRCESFDAVLRSSAECDGGDDV